MLEYVNCIAGDARSAVLMVPGLGCGLFAGPFHGKLGSELRDVLIRLLEDFGDTLPNLKAVYFDPYDECINSRFEINGISLLVRPLTQPGNARRSQLCTPVTYQDAGDDTRTSRDRPLSCGLVGRSCESLRCALWASVAVVRCVEVDLRADGDDAGRIDRRVATVVVLFDVIEVDRGRDLAPLIEVARERP